MYLSKNHSAFMRSCVHALTHCFNDSLVRWLVDSLSHCFVDSLIHCFIDSLVHRFIGSLFHPLICARILSCHFIGISTTMCSCADAPHSFNRSWFLHLKNVPIGHLLFSKLPPWHMPGTIWHFCYCCAVEILVGLWWQEICMALVASRF